jgi:hypothetical protein
MVTAKKPVAKKAAPKKPVSKTGNKLATDPRVAATLAKIASGETDGLDMALVKEIMGQLGMKVVAKGVAEQKYSRIEKRRQWLTATELSEEEQQIIKSLPETLGKAPTMLAEDEVRDFTQDEIDLVMEEELVLRPTEDMISGRKDALRTTVLNLVSFRDEDNDPFATATITSPKYGYKFDVTTSKRGGDADFSLLEDKVSAEVWESITDEVVTRVPNEEKINAAFQAGLISIEDFTAILTEPKVSRVLNIRPLKEGDEL